MTLKGIFCIANTSRMGIKTIPDMFDFAHHIQLLIEDIVEKVSVFSHINPEQILISASRAKKRGDEGTWAELYPMKYENGHYSISERRDGKIFLYKTKQLKVGRTEILYIIYFLMPRFQNLTAYQKLDTIFHELYHISPDFNGKLRQIHPRFSFHGPSMKLYDQKTRVLMREYLNGKPNRRRLKFLDYSYFQLRLKYQSIDMLNIPEPKETLQVMVSKRKKRRAKKKF